MRAYLVLLLVLLFPMSGSADNTAVMTNSSGKFVSPVGALRGGLKQAQFWDDIQASPVSPYLGPSPSGQTYAYLNSGRAIISADPVSGGTFELIDTATGQGVSLQPYNISAATLQAAIRAGMMTNFLNATVTLSGNVYTIDRGVHSAIASPIASGGALIPYGSIATIVQTQIGGGSQDDIWTLTLSINELVNTSATGAAYYLQAITGNPVINFGCTGTFANGRGARSSGYSQGVILLTSAADAGSFLPQNFLHIRWNFQTLIVEATNTFIAGPPGLVRLATVPINCNVGVGDEIAAQFVLDGAKLTCSIAGQTATIYSPYFTESTWGTVIYEEIGGSGSTTDIDEWKFHSLWANTPTPGIPGVTTQAHSQRLDQLAEGNLTPSFTGIPSLGASNTWTGNNNFSNGAQVAGLQVSSYVTLPATTVLGPSVFSALPSPVGHAGYIGYITDGPASPAGNAIVSSGGGSTPIQLNADGTNWRVAGGVPGTTIASSSITGTTTNNSAAAGILGEYVSSTIAVGAAVSLTTATPLTVTSISLTAGDWDVTGVCDFHPGALTTGSYFEGGISTTTNALGSQDQFSASPMALAAGVGIDVGLNAPVSRISIASTTTVYLTVQAGFATSTMVAYGTIRARRVR